MARRRGGMVLNYAPRPGSGSHRAESKLESLLPCGARSSDGHQGASHAMQRHLKCDARPHRGRCRIKPARTRRARRKPATAGTPSLHPARTRLGAGTLPMRCTAGGGSNIGSVRNLYRVKAATSSPLPQLAWSSQIEPADRAASPEAMAVDGRHSLSRLMRIVRHRRRTSCRGTPGQ
jgi:hypothetical protein